MLLAKTAPTKLERAPNSTLPVGATSVPWKRLPEPNSTVVAGVSTKILSRLPRSAEPGVIAAPAPTCRSPRMVTIVRSVGAIDISASGSTTSTLPPRSYWSTAPAPSERLLKT